MTEVNHEKEAEKAEYRRHVGDFDAYVQDEQEKDASQRYAEYLQQHPESDLSFEDWCDEDCARDNN